MSLVLVIEKKAGDWSFRTMRVVFALGGFHLSLADSFDTHCHFAILLVLIVFSISIFFLLVNLALFFVLHSSQSFYLIDLGRMLLDIVIHFLFITVFVLFGSLIIW